VSVSDRKMSVRMTSWRTMVVMLCTALSAVACSGDGDVTGWLRSRKSLWQAPTWRSTHPGPSRS
jgi:hypothetical protein